MLKIERNSYLLKVDRFLFSNANMAKIYERSLSTIMAQGKFRDSFDPRSQTLSGEESTWKGECLEIPRVVDCFFCLLHVSLDLAVSHQMFCFIKPA